MFIYRSDIPKFSKSWKLERDLHEGFHAAKLCRMMVFPSYRTAKCNSLSWLIKSNGSKSRSSAAELSFYGTYALATVTRKERVTHIKHVKFPGSCPWPLAQGPGVRNHIYSKFLSDLNALQHANNWPVQNSIY